MSANESTNHRTPSHGEAAPAAAPRSRRAGLAAALLVLTLAGGWAVGRSGPEAAGLLEFASASSGPVQLRGRLDRSSVLAGGDGQLGMELILSADRPAATSPLRLPTDLLVVLDRSGSMSGKPIQDARAAVRDLIARLGPQDRFALVTYESSAELWIPLQPVGSGGRDALLRAVDRVGPGGGTNMAAGLDLAFETLVPAREPGRMPRVLLLSDGHANEGDHSFEGLRARARRALESESVLSAVGVGDGFDEALMTALADAGTGNFYYVRDGSDLGDVFAGEFDSARETVASAVTVEIELAPGVELLDAAGYPVERVGRVVRFRPGSLFAGQERRIWLSLKAPNDRLGDISLGAFRLHYREPDALPGAAPLLVRIEETPTMACVQDEKVYAASLDEGLLMRNLAEDKLSALKLGVAASLRDGDYTRAEQQIEAFKSRNAAPLRSLGYDPKDTEAYREADALALEVEEAFQSPQSAPARNRLSKKLSASGQDGRRAGAKKQR